MTIPKGKLIAIGGNEDKYTDPEPNFRQHNNPHFFKLGILKRFISETEKGTDSNIEIITTATGAPEELGETYFNAFAEIGCKNIGVLHIKERSDSNDKNIIKRLVECDGVMFTGGNQLRLSTVLGGTEALKVLQNRYLHDKFVIAGTSAGAMAMSNTMIYQGSSTEALLKGEVKITTGLAFIKDVIIDSHFVKRGRFGRLAQAVALNPACLGIGLGEDTGVLITEGDKLETIGSGLVILFDGHNISYSNISEIEEGTPISIRNLLVQVLANRDCYSLNNRSFLPSATSE
jgi:cyanophycinase